MASKVTPFQTFRPLKDQEPADNQSDMVAIRSDSTTPMSYSDSSMSPAPSPSPFLYSSSPSPFSMRTTPSSNGGTPFRLTPLFIPDDIVTHEEKMQPVKRGEEYAARSLKSALAQEALQGTEKQELALQKIDREGANGSYFVLYRKSPNGTPKRIGIFKPSDESLGAKQGRGGIGGNSDRVQSRVGISPEESSMMECVGYLLGKDYNVPQTIILQLTSSSFQSNETILSYSEGNKTYYTKEGSLQRFVPDACNFKSIRHNALKPILSTVDPLDIQKLALLDILSYNTDRNKGNVMIDKKNKKLIPIDHGCIAARAFNSGKSTLCWMQWPSQALFTPFDRSLIKELDWERSKAKILDSFPEFPKESLSTLNVCHYLVKRGASLGLTPYQLGAFLTIPSILEITPLRALYLKLKDPKKMKRSLDDGHLLSNFKKFCDVEQQKQGSLAISTKAMGEYLMDTIAKIPS